MAFSHRKVASSAVALLLSMGFVMSSQVLTAQAAEVSSNSTVVTPNPWYTNGPFQGWGTSLAWFANATGAYGEEGSISRSSGSAEADQRALAYGAKLREDFYQSIFGTEGLNLNKARINIGGGNASDVAYGYPFMRQGAAVPGYWADDIDGSKQIYGGVGTSQANKEALNSVFDPEDDDQYDWSKGKAQEWWIQRGARDADVTHWETFANSAPWFMTESGYATGGFNSSSNNLRDSTKFAQYLAHVTEHFEDTFGIKINTIEPLNESETNYWSTPNQTAATVNKDTDPLNHQLIERYKVNYPGAKLNVTPYSTAVKKPQEGMHVDTKTAQKLYKELEDTIGADSETKIVGTDATSSDQFVNSYSSYSNETRNILDQYNVHSYGTKDQRVVRDIAQADGKILSMSEVDGSWQNGGFNPFGFDNAMGMSEKINSDIYTLQSSDFTFWQVVEDLYNMQVPSSSQDPTNNPPGEDTNWGTILIDFDCTVAGQDGKLYSKRRVDNNGGRTEGIDPCSVLVNSKYNAVRAYTRFIHEGDSIVANDQTSNALTAQSKDGETQTIIFRNNRDEPQEVVVDLSNYKKIDSKASGRQYLTTAPDLTTSDISATPEYMNRYSNIEQPDDAVSIQGKDKIATFTVPANSISSVQLHGVSGVADAARAISENEPVSIVGQQSGKSLAFNDVNSQTSSVLEIAGKPESSEDGSHQIWRFKEVKPSTSARTTLHTYVLKNSNGEFLTVKNNIPTLEELSDTEVSEQKNAHWILNTEDGKSFSLLNAGAKKVLDVDGQGTVSGTSVGIYESNGGDNQAWKFMSIRSVGVQEININTAVGVVPELPQTVSSYYEWGEGEPVLVKWQADSLAEAVKRAGEYSVVGSGQDFYGNKLNFSATVYVGDLTVTDPTSMTVSRGAELSVLKKSAPTAVNAYSGIGGPVEVAVTWNWDEAGDINLNRTGEFTVQGYVKQASGNVLHTLLTVFVTEPSEGDGQNLAQHFCKSTTASSQENLQSGPDKTCDGNPDSAWSNWKNEADQTDLRPWLNYSFDRAYKLSRLEFLHVNEAVPQSLNLEYRDSEGKWKVFEETPFLVETGNEKSSSIDLRELPQTEGIRLHLDYYENGYYAKVGEVKIFESESRVSPASSSALSDLRVAGKTISNFKSENTEYSYPLGGSQTEYPLVQAAPMDKDSSLYVEQADSDNAGTATVHVKSADLTHESIYTIRFGEPSRLSYLEINPPKQTTYQIGQKLDTETLAINAVYMRGKEIATKVKIDLDDKDLVISGFQPLKVGKQKVTVAYRSVIASFEVEVLGQTEPVIDSPNSTEIVGEGAPDPSQEPQSLPRTGSDVIEIVCVGALSGFMGLISLFIVRKRGETA